MQKNRPGILLVEDDPPLGKALEDNLAALGGFQVFRAETVREALHFATEYPTLRFIYLDIGIPDYEPFTKQETQDGRLTGLRLLPELEELLPKASQPGRYSGSRRPVPATTSADVDVRKRREAPQFRDQTRLLVPDAA